MLIHICQDRGYDDSAVLEGISAWAVKTQTKHLREKLNVVNLAQVVVRVLQFHFYSP